MIRVICCLLVLSSVCLADDAYDRAMQRLREKQAAQLAKEQAEQAATTQPAQITRGELAALRNELATLKAKVVELEKENAKLRQKLQPTEADARLGRSAQEAGRIQGALAANQIVVGMTTDEASQVLKAISLGRFRETSHKLVNGESVDYEHWRLYRKTENELYFTSGILTKIETDPLDGTP